MIARSIRFGGTGKSSIRRLAAYLISHQENEERVLAWRITNCLEDIGRETGFEEDDVRLAAAAMQLTQQANTRARGDKTYHLVVSFRERPNAAQLRHVENELCSALGFGENERISVLHGDTDNIHLHIAINKIHPVTHRMVSPFHDHTILANACRRLENELSILADNHEFRAEGRASAATQMEKAGDTESLAGWIQRELSPVLLKAASWEEFHAILAEHGLELKLAGNGCTFTNGSIRVKGSTVNRAFSKSRLEAKFGPWKEPTQAPGQGKTYVRKPMNHGRDTSSLWAEYEQWRDARKKGCREALYELDLQKQKEIHALFGLTPMEAGIRYFVKDRNMRRVIRALMAHNRKEEIRKIRMKYGIKKKKIQAEHRLVSWKGWMENRVREGSSEAIEALRARGHAPTGDAVGMDIRREETPVKVTSHGTRIFSDGTREFRNRWTASSLPSLAGLLNRNGNGPLAVFGSEKFRNTVFALLRSRGITPAFLQPEIRERWQERKPLGRQIYRGR